MSAASAVEGQLTATEGTLSRRISVELHLEGRIADRSYVNEDGSFRFTNISLRPLTNPLPRAVQKQLRRSDEAMKNGDTERSLEYLRQALSACAGCAEVHNNPGVRYMKLGKFAEAVADFQQAVDPDPHSALASSNLAIALVIVKDCGAAEVAARRALQLDGGAVAARYALGRAGLSRKECTDDIVAHLRASADVYPRARLPAAAAPVCGGNVPAAIGELNSYLSQPIAEQREKVQEWLSQLQKKERYTTAAELVGSK